ncbi:Hypothetical_protein [Hexamita inflata]|uniref:Hypothetical_protein n=1 Tax=Hexamita inflata TaxID=28002 RepID=A0AA86PRN8_9EUKA|nr:Hypothetical protein HINF_LOCUS32106 [Hexamita inflata]CAI9944463.1 Hypothetical protein HINF_LOCUS32108 [Hexamita inflata]
MYRKHSAKGKMQHLAIINEGGESAQQTLQSPNNTDRTSLQERVESQSCDIFWDQSSKTNVLLTKIRIVNGRKSMKNISIETKKVENQTASSDSFFDIFSDSVFK